MTTNFADACPRHQQDASPTPAWLHSPPSSLLQPQPLLPSSSSSVLPSSPSPIPNNTRGKAADTTPTSRPRRGHGRPSLETNEAFNIPRISSPSPTSSPGGGNLPRQLTASSTASSSQALATASHTNTSTTASSYQLPDDIIRAIVSIDAGSVVGRNSVYLLDDDEKLSPIGTGTGSGIADQQQLDEEDSVVLVPPLLVRQFLACMEPIFARV